MAGVPADPFSPRPTRPTSTFADRWDKSTSKAILQDILNAVTLSGRVNRGEVDQYAFDPQTGEVHTNPELIDDAGSLAGMLTLGAGAVPAGANELRMGIKAFHGSPHSFDKFSSENIGTGEGAQAYGHGLYFAENEGVAKEYRKRLSRVSQALDELPPEAEAKYGPVLDALAVKRDAASTQLERSKIEDAMDALQEQINDEFDLAGRMYEVDIAANPEDFLDWDKPLSEQSAGVREALSKAVSPEEAQRIEVMTKRLDALNRAIDRGGASADAAIDEKRALISELDKIDPSVAKTPEIAAKLRQAGIPGIRYLDQGSRNAGEGSSNYVVFDDSLISILKKYGVVGPVLAALGLSQAMPDRAEASEQQGGGW